MKNIVVYSDKERDYGLHNLFKIETKIIGEPCKNKDLNINVGILNDSVVRVLSYLSHNSWNKIYKDITDFSLKDKYKGRVFSDKKVVRNYLKKFGLIETKVNKKDYINVLNFIIHNRTGDFVLLIDIGNKEPYCLIYTNNIICDNNISSKYLNALLSSELISVFTPEDEGYETNIDISSCKNKSILDLMKIEIIENNNPMEYNNNNDCTIRAISYITGKSWKEVYKELSKTARKLNKSDEYEYKRNIFATINTTNYYFEKMGFSILGVENNLNLYNFLNDNKKGIYILCVNNHMFVYDNGKIVDDTKYNNEYLDYILRKNIARIIYNSKEDGIMYI